MLDGYDDCVGFIDPEVLIEKINKLSWTGFQDDTYVMSRSPKISCTYVLYVYIVHLI